MCSMASFSRSSTPDLLFPLTLGGAEAAAPDILCPLRSGDAFTADRVPTWAFPPVPGSTPVGGSAVSRTRTGTARQDRRRGRNGQRPGQARHHPLYNVGNRYGPHDSTPGVAVSRSVRSPPPSGD
ncbi:hypothetical protein GCM10010335_60050 [Streptomyces galbus]|nr:hypothetical protein GCM10010335_60050 [Streptomyces galbus]